MGEEFIDTEVLSARRDPSDFAESDGQFVLAKIGRELSQQLAGRQDATGQGGSNPQDVRPVPHDDVLPDFVAGQSDQGFRDASGLEDMQPFRRQVPDARDESIAEQGCGGEDMVGETAGVGVLLADAPPHPASATALALGSPVQSCPGPVASPATPVLTSSPTIGVPTSPLPTSQPKIPQHLAPDRPASFSCCVLSLSEWLNTTTADHLPTPKIQNLPGQSLLWVPYTLLRHLYHPLRWIRDWVKSQIEGDWECFESIRGGVFLRLYSRTRQH